MKNTKIISGFPGIGKSFLSTEYKNLDIIDSDSSLFSWTITDGTKVRNPDFPNNYLNHIVSNIGKVDVIMVSSHKDVRNILNQNEIKAYLVYPDRSLKDEYVERYKLRNSDEKFIEFISNNWDNFMDELDAENMIKIVLTSGQYLSDVFDDILNGVAIVKSFIHHINQK